MKFKAGQTVHVKISGLTIVGVIKEITKTGEYVVQFEGGSEKSIPEKSIKPVESRIARLEINAPKSDVRRRSPSRRSPSRSRSKISPSPIRRSPGRQKSSNTVSVSPSRKSPARRTRKTSPSPARVKNVSRTTTPTRILKVSLENVEGCGDYSLRNRKPIEHAPEPEKLQTVTHDNIIESVIPTSLPVENDEDNFEKNQAQLNEQNDNLINEISKFSDDDEIITELKLLPRERKSEPKLLRPPKEFCGWFGASCLTILIPVSVLCLHIICDKKCSFVEISNLEKYKFHETYLDYTSFLTYIAYVLFISMLSKIPYIGIQINNQPSKDKKFCYKMNGLSSAFIILALLIILESLQIPVVHFIADKYFQLMVSSLICGFVFSILLFIKSKFVSVSLLNPYGSTYNFIYDFFMGRQINPKFLNFDIKIILLRSSYIAALLFNSIYLMKATNVFLRNDSFLSVEAISFDPTFFTCAGLQIFYILDFLFFENQLTTTFELQYEGLGYMKTILYAAYPFYLTATTKYLFENNGKTQHSASALIAICLLFIAGYIMYRGSNSQKNAFRLNPYDPALSHLECMPTGQGKKLLISGWWGHLRHPNYCGDIIMHLSIGALCAGSPAGLGVLPPALMLAIRAVRDSNRCRRRYGTAWERYTQKVRYSIAPLVY